MQRSVIVGGVAVLLAVAGCGSEGATVADPAKRARQAVAAARDVRPKDVRVEILDRPEVPAVVVFRARVGGGARVGSTQGGIVAGERVELDQDRAITTVLRAWGYGPLRTRPPADVASVTTYLIGGLEGPAMLISSAGRIALLREDWRPLVGLPHDVDLDGRPGVEFWVDVGSAGDTGPGLRRVRVAVGPDGAASLAADRISDLLARGG